MDMGYNHLWSWAVVRCFLSLFNRLKTMFRSAIEGYEIDIIV